MKESYSTLDVAKAIAHYEENFNHGDTTPANYYECAQWLEGYMVGADLTEVSAMRRCINVLMGGGHFTTWLQRHNG